MGLFSLFRKSKKDPTHKAARRTVPRKTRHTRKTFDTQAIDRLTREIELIKGALALHDKKVERYLNDIALARNVVLKENELRAVSIIREYIKTGKPRSETIKRIASEDLSKQLVSRATAYRLYNREQQARIKI
jgi:hypothetical protein